MLSSLLSRARSCCRGFVTARKGHWVWTGGDDTRVAWGRGRISSREGRWGRREEAAALRRRLFPKTGLFFSLRYSGRPIAPVAAPARGPATRRHRMHRAPWNRRWSLPSTPETFSHLHQTLRPHETLTAVTPAPGAPAPASVCVDLPADVFKMQQLFPGSKSDLNLGAVGAAPPPGATGSEFINHHVAWFCERPWALPLGRE